MIRRAKTNRVPKIDGAGSAVGTAMVAMKATGLMHNSRHRWWGGFWLAAYEAGR